MLNHATQLKEQKIYKPGFLFVIMEVEIVESGKGIVELKLDNLTIAEIMRVYLNEGGVEFAAWKREHPTKPLIFRIESSKSVKKEVADAVSTIKKDLDEISKGLKKSK